MRKPKYAKDDIYKELENICELAGRKVSYTDEIHSYAVAMTDKYTQIRMPENVSGVYDYLDNEQDPTEVLGHELGHCLIENDARIVNYYRALLPEREQNIELDEEAICDYIGVVLHSLAEIIAIKQIEGSSKAGFTLNDTGEEV
jgi:hypothetical protein